MDARYWGRVASMLATHPRETLARVRQRNELRRFASAPSVDYDADPDWERELIARLDTDAESEGWRDVADALERELPDFPYGHDADVRLAGCIWRIVRATRAERVFETGVARGVSSRFALEALEANGRGHLWSVDLPPVLTGFHSSVGAAVPERLRHRWTYIRGSSRDRLPRLLREVGSVDVFVQDSLGTPPTVLFELTLAWRALRPGGWLVVSGISRGTGLRSFLALESPRSVIVAQSGPKRSSGGGAVHGQFALLEKGASSAVGGGAAGTALRARGRDTAAVAETSPSAWRRFLSYSWRRRLVALRHRAERLAPGYDETLRDRFQAEVVSRGTFGSEWFLEHVRPWDRMLAEFDGRRDLRFLEIGSYEGLSACFLLWRLLERTGGTLVCVDTFAGSVEHEGVSGLEERFDANIAEFGWSGLVRKEKGDSRRVLLDLLDEGASASFDFVYVDGSHHSLDVLVDAVLGWRLLAPGGLLVFDDYLWDTDPDELGNPRRGIDAFTRLVRDRSRVLSRGSQLVLRKARG